MDGVQLKKIFLMKLFTQKIFLELSHFVLAKVSL